MRPAAPRNIQLDEWGYPIVDGALVEPAEATTAVTLCPARALYLKAAGSS